MQERRTRDLGVERTGGDAGPVRRDERDTLIHAHALPSVENGASNAICRRLGLTLLEA